LLNQYKTISLKYLLVYDLIKTFPHSSKEKKKRTEGISRPFSSIGIDPGINVELKVVLKMALFELIDIVENLYP
jgi:hypothetical protein